MTTTGKIATGFITGTLIGATIGLLFAPKAGAKTRALIADQAKYLKEKASKTFEKAKKPLAATNEKSEVLGV